MLIAAIASAGLSLTAADSTNANPRKAAPATPATPATPALPATPGAPDVSATPATPATPAIPATPATPAPPGQVTVKSQTKAATPAVPPVGDPVLTPTGRSQGAWTAPVDPAKLGADIRATSLSSRDHVIADLESRLSATETALSGLEGPSREMTAEGRKHFKALSDDVKDRARALRKSAQAARKASEQEWDSARAQLAADYEAYAAALARADAAAAPVRR